MKTLTQTNLELLRSEIDEIDTAWLEALAHRFAVTEQVGRYKVEHGITLVDPVSEQAQLERIAEKATELGIDPQLAQAILRIIIDKVVENHLRISSQQ